MGLSMGLWGYSLYGAMGDLLYGVMGDSLNHPLCYSLSRSILLSLSLSQENTMIILHEYKGMKIAKENILIGNKKN